MIKIQMTDEKKYTISDAEDIAMDWWMYATHNQLPDGPARPFFRRWLEKREEGDTWISVEDALPIIDRNDAKYFEVKLANGTTDEKPFRNRPTQNINGFMSEIPITHYREITLFEFD